MYIRVEPAGFSMYTVQMAFDPEDPDSEDQPVRDYLTEHGLEPRHQWTAEFDGRQCQWMQFGGCYLGRHLNEIGQIQRRAVEVELLTAEIENYLDSLQSGADAPAGERRRQAVSRLVEEFHRDSSFQLNAGGELTAVLDQAELEIAARRVLGG
jgi:triphosphoribosyl-dephospho-CoA synthetase